MSLQTILVDRADGIVTVTMNRPERKNAGNGLMWQELRATFDEVAHSSKDRVLVLTGAGGAFCSGADITDPAGVSGDPTDPHLVRMRHFGQVMLALHGTAPADHRQDRRHCGRRRAEYGARL